MKEKMNESMPLSIQMDGVDVYEAFGVVVRHRDIGVPSKKKVLEQIPFSNTTLDFSDLYGEGAFEERTMTYTFNLCPDYRTQASSELPKAQLTNFLMGKKQFKLFDDIFPGYYFLAELRDGPNFDHNIYLSELAVTFTAYPFRIDSLAEGHDIWDDFNFELDVAQVTEFDVNVSEHLTLINNGMPIITPEIITSSPMTIRAIGREHRFSEGTFRNHDFYLPKGETRLNIIGNGNIKFNFHKELI